MEDRETPQMHKYEESKMTQIMMATVRHMTSSSGLCGAEYTHQEFRLLLVRNSIEEAGKSQECPTPRLVGRPSAAATFVEICHNQHWLVKSSTKLLFISWPDKRHSVEVCQM
jgi:hypothetical protein